MKIPSETEGQELRPDLILPITLLVRYLIFFSRRPVSASNTGFLTSRIASLLTLAPLLEDSGCPRAMAIAARLKELAPVNMKLKLPELMQLTDRFLSTVLPVETLRLQQLSESFFDVKKILIIFGPAIGIGDEMIFFPLPQWLQRRCPQCQITVMSCYDGLWNPSHNLEIKPYREMAELLDALQSESDLTILADFEKPGILPAISQAQASEMGRFMEISLGTCHLETYDPRFPSYFQTTKQSHSAINFYHTLDQLMREVGLAPQPEDRSTSLLGLGLDDQKLARLLGSLLNWFSAMGLEILTT